MSYATEINFPDKFSISIININKFSKTDEATKLEIVKNFMNDSYWFLSEIENLEQIALPYQFNGGNGIITNKYISKFTELENLFYRLIDRVAIRPLPTIQKRKFYFEILKYWKNFFENNEIDKIIFVSHPHTYYEIVPFFLAKDLGIKTYIMKLTSIPNFTFLDTITPFLSTMSLLKAIL